MPTTGALLFVETNHITAVGAGRILWNRKVSNDGVRIVNVRDGMIEGVAWQYPDEEVGFTIDAATGRVEGGTPYD